MFASILLKLIVAVFGYISEIGTVVLHAEAYATHVQYEAIGGLRQQQLGKGKAYWESADDGGTKTSGTVSAFDARGNRTDLYEYGYGGAPAIATDPPDPAFPNYVKRKCPVVSGTVNPGYLRHTVTAYRDDYAATPIHQPSLVSSNTVYERQYPGNVATDVQASQSTFAYDATAVDAAPIPTNWDAPGQTQLGNLTSVTRALSDLYTDPGNNLSATTYADIRRFDKAGNLTAYTDTRGNQTQYGYSSGSTACLGTAPPGELAAFLTQVTFPAVNGVTQTQTWQYDCFLGRPRSFVDRDAVTTSFTYETEANKLGRLKTITKGGTTFTYNDAANSPTVEIKKDQYAPSDNRLYSKVYYDGLGREYRTDSGLTAPIVSLKNLDGFGRVRNQYRPYSGSAGTFKQFEYDSLGRVTGVTDTADSSVATTVYSLDDNTTTDENGKKTRRTTDALAARGESPKKVGGSSDLRKVVNVRVIYGVGQAKKK